MGKGEKMTSFHWGEVLDALDDAADRIKTLEQQPVPAHWMKQWLNPAELPPNVVMLRTPRHAEQYGGAA